MKITREYLKKIRPKESGVSDKYSWNIYRFLRKYRNWDIKVLDTKEWGRIFSFSIHPDNGEKSNLECGYSGRSIQAILTLNWNQSLETYFYLSPCKEYQDITEDFFKKYLLIGRCIFDPDHSWYHDSKIRYTQVTKNSRRCNWCGEYFKRVIVKKAKITREENWERIERYVERSEK